MSVLTPDQCQRCITNLTSNREEFINALYPNYSYDDLIMLVNNIRNACSVIQTISTSSMDTATDVSGTKIIYDTFAGICNNKKYITSAISWIPAKELIVSLLNLGYLLGVKQIDVLNAEMGILPALLKWESMDIKSIIQESMDLEILAADTFKNQSTCNSMGYVDIARRSVNDYTYYEALKKPYPEMVIIYNYVHGCMINYENILRMFESFKHKVIIVFSSIFASSGFETAFNYLTNTDKYTIYSFPVKSIDMYQDIQQEIQSAYPYGIIGHVLVNRQTNKEVTLDMIKSVL